MLQSSDLVGAFVDYPKVAVRSAGRGLLAGLRLAVKDIFDVAGYPTGAGHPLFAADSGIRPSHAHAVARLLDAGATFVGKTHTDEFAYSMNGENPHYGTPVNVRAPGRIPGGSSSGSVAAVAAGLADIALGSDTGGSVRLPASYCGLVGLRTTHGRIDMTGVHPLAPSFDTVGWFAEDIDTYERVGAVLLGEDRPAPPITRMLVAPDVEALLPSEAEKEAFARGLAVVRGHLAPAGEILAAPNGFDHPRHLIRVIQAYEVWRAHGEWIERRRPSFGPGVRERFEWARGVSIAEYERALSGKAEIHARLSGLIGDDAVLVIPTVPSVAPPLGVTGEALEAYRRLAIGMLCSAGLSGLPQMSIPLAEIEGLPFGISLLGPPGRDRALIALARRMLGARDRQ